LLTISPDKNHFLRLCLGTICDFVHGEIQAALQGADELSVLISQRFTLGYFRISLREMGLAGGFFGFAGIGAVEWEWRPFRGRIVRSF